MLIRYLELSVTTPAGARDVLVPMNFCRVRSGKDAHIKVHSVLASQFVDAPALKSDNQITLDEEERVAAYYGGGRLYATPERQEPLA
jgi:photosynthetic reaction center H subunit